MLSRIVEFALTQRLLMLVLTALLVGAGIVAMRSLPIDAFPDVSTTQVKIIVKAPGMTPEEVESRITVPIEQEMLGIPSQRLLRAVSKYGITDITIDFDDGTDIYWARQQVAERFASAMDLLPAQASGGLAPITTPLGEMYMFTIEGPLSLEEKRTLLERVIRPQLRTIAGVADVNILGGHSRAYEIVPNPQLLAARGIGLDQLREAVERNNRNDGAGRLADGEEALIVRAEGAVRNVEDLAAIVVEQRNGAPVRVGDVAEVRIGSLTRNGAVSRDGRGEAVQGLVLGLRGANAQAVIEGVKARLAAIAPGLPAGVTIETFYDRSSLVERAVGTVSRSLLEAIVLVMALLLAFLGNLRAALVVALTLPLAALGTFVLMRYTGLSANLMSLGGLAIAIGLLVDASVVVVENVETRLSEGGATAPTSKLHLVYRAVREVAVPVTSGVCIIVIVFVPLLTLQGLEGKLFIPVALSIVYALSVSLLLALTVIPVLASLLLRQGAAHEPWLVRKLDAAYRPALGWAMAHGRSVVLAAFALLLLAGGAYAMVGKSFMPTMDEGDIIMQLEKLPSISLEQTLDVDTRIQRAILERVPEVRSIVARSGSDELGLDPMGLNQTDTFLVLAPIETWRRPDKGWLADQLRAVAADFPGVEATFTQPIEMRVSEMLTGVRGDVAIKVFGNDLARLGELASRIERLLAGIEGAEDVFTAKNEGMQYLQVVIDRLAAGRLGLSVDEIQASLRSVIEGQVAGSVVESGRRVPILIRADEDFRASLARFSDLRLPIPGAGAVPLSAVAHLERVDGPVKIDRENGARYVTIQANVRGRDLVGFVEQAQARVASEIALPAGYGLEWSGQFENQQRAAARLAIVVPIALLLIFLLLFSTFGSVRQAVLVLANVPFALVGGVFGLLLAGEYLSVPASVGFIALLGIAVLNGVVLVTYFNQLLDKGMTITEAVVEGARRRLRPVMMTASIAAFGLVPLLFASGPGSEIQRPLAVVVIGGLVSSTLLTLLLLPILFRRFGLDRRPAATEGARA
ncbi:CusA/CzcA family heavy metal efflux RND transporter [Burkholderiaceae bacterium FT117]|uniref:efflux RND transporter permease subunit n=1 Tax=Zeimonas sediminis TaxID=2944268 RepID=UPI002342F224|nr:CusA/CzcA family heavy metal efflux RND transporter [Zeimonas sediminis]MCM5569412.1 CusA/CzcA family heavy metal efflux RND transporter [Zeimonas sediminis]